MELNDYQSLARQTSRFANVSPIQRENILMSILGLCGETGELADYLKKAFYHSHELNISTLILELGDIAWYLAEMCTALDLSLDDVCVENIEKLRKRYGNAFSTEASIHRQRHRLET